MRRGLPVLLASAVCAALSGCASARGSGKDGAVFDLDDARGDVRLVHPRHPQIETRHFDLVHASLRLEGDQWRLEATFAEPIPTLTEVRAARDRVVAMVPQTLDLYLDLADGRGHVPALPGRGFEVPASEAWDRVLVASSVADLSEDDVVHALHLGTQGRRLVATFPRASISDPAQVRGALLVVLATSPTSDGRVREVTRSGAECRVWDDERCRLEGEGPAVLDALAVEVAGGRLISLHYPGARPAPAGVAVVFSRGSLIGAAPVATDEAKKGDLATLYDAAGTPLGTAVVVSVVGDTASLEVMGSPVEGAARVVFAKGATR